MNITIVIPTYNEAENIPKLVPQLDDVFKQMPNHNFIVVVVDDTSPDGTAQVVEKFSQEYPFLHLKLKPEKTGIGDAYVFGFKHVMKEFPQTDAVLEMDADLQHDPKDLHKFVQKLDEGYDYVIGSRFIEGGSIPKDWAIGRKILSIYGNVFTKLMLWIFDVHDFTSGFKATKMSYLKQLDLDNVLSGGFAYKVHLLYQTYKLGAKTTEVPITFQLREEGTSKIEGSTGLDTLRVVISIRYQESKSFFRFAVVGFAGLFTDVFLFNVLNYYSSGSDRSIFGFELNLASALSGLVAMTLTYLLNNFWSFNKNKKANIGRLLLSYPFYAFFSYIPIVFRSWLIDTSAEIFGSNILVYNVAFFVGVIIGTIWNFTMYSKVIWRKKKPGAVQQA